MVCVVRSPNPAFRRYTIAVLPKRFPPSIIAAFDACKYLYIRSGDHRFIGIWVVVVEGRVLVRSWNDKPSGWYRAFLKHPRGNVRLSKNGDDIPIRASRPRGARLLDAYAAKYDTKSNLPFVKGFRAPERKATTLELLPG